MAVYYDNTPKVSLQEASPLAFCIEATQNEQKLFDAVLEADFLQLYSESVLLEADGEEAKAEDGKAPEGEKKDDAEKATKDNIFKKIGEMVKNAFEAIKKFFIGLWEKIKSIFADDKKIMERYGKLLSDSESYAGYKPKVVFADGIDSFKGYLDKVSGDLRANVVAAKNNNFDEVKEYELPDLTVKNASEASNSDFVAKVIAYFNNSEYQALKKANDLFEKDQLDTVKKAGEQAKNSSAKDNNEAYKAISKKVKAIMKYNGVYAKAVGRVVKTARAEYIKVGIYAVQHKSGKKEEKKDTENVNASFIYDTEDIELREYYVDLANDQYVSECFSLA